MINESGQNIYRNVLLPHSGIANAELILPVPGYVGQESDNPFERQIIRNIMLEGKIIAALLQHENKEETFLSIHFYSPVTGNWELFPGWEYTKPGSDWYAVHISGATFRLWYKW